MRIASKILAVMSLLVFALLSQSASACFYPDGKCGSSSEAATEAAPAAEDAVPAEADAPAAEATEEAVEDD